MVDFRSNKNPHSGTEVRGLMRNKNKPRNLIFAQLAGEEREFPVQQTKKISKVNKHQILNDLIGLKFKSSDNKINRKIKKKK